MKSSTEENKPKRMFRQLILSLIKVIMSLTQTLKQMMKNMN